MKQKVIKLSCGEGHCLAIISGQENSKVIWSWGNNKFGQLGHGNGNETGKRLPKPINYLLTFCEERNNSGDKVQFEDISCGGFHSLCLAKYKQSIDWIENDLRIIVNIIKNKEDEISINYNNYFSLNNESDFSSAILGNINKI